MFSQTISLRLLCSLFDILQYSFSLSESFSSHFINAHFMIIMIRVSIYSLSLKSFCLVRRLLCSLYNNSL